MKLTELTEADIDHGTDPAYLAELCVAANRPTVVSVVGLTRQATSGDTWFFEYHGHGPIQTHWGKLAVAN